VVLSKDQDEKFTLRNPSALSTLLGALIGDLREILTSVELTTLMNGAGTSYLQFTFGVNASLKTVDMVSQLIECDFQEGLMPGGGGKRQGWSALLVGELVSRLGASLASERSSIGGESLVLKVPYGVLKIERATRESPKPA
jgi:hypothetical protein